MTSRTGVEAIAALRCLYIQLHDRRKFQLEFARDSSARMGHDCSEQCLRLPPHEAESQKRKRAALTDRPLCRLSSDIN